MCITSFVRIHISIEFDKNAFLHSSSDHSSSSPRNETLTVVVHVLPDDLLRNRSLVWLLAKVDVDPLVSNCRSDTRTTKLVHAKNTSVLCELSIRGDEDTTCSIHQIHLLSELV